MSNNEVWEILTSEVRDMFNSVSLLKIVLKNKFSKPRTQNRTTKEEVCLRVTVSQTFWSTYSNWNLNL